VVIVTATLASRAPIPLPAKRLQAKADAGRLLDPRLRGLSEPQSLQGGSLMPWSRLHHRDGIDDYVEAMTPETVFFNDVDTLTARRAVSQLGYQSYASMRQRLTETAWKSIPSTYVICENDNAIPVAVQEVLAERADDVQRLSTSHSPFLSQPAALARLIRRSLARSSTTEF
jgi:pimeloyl-ACP methyl ester carboxylesterase